MDNQQIRKLVELAVEQDLAELELEQHGVRVRIRRKEPVIQAAPMSVATPGAIAAPQPPPGGSEGRAGMTAGAHVVRSPMVGTFYSSPEPGADAFVQVGDRVDEGQTLCIIEAMKLMNEITADAAGEIVAVMVENGKPVEYGQELFAIRSA